MNGWKWISSEDSIPDSRLKNVRSRDLEPMTDSLTVLAFLTMLKISFSSLLLLIAVLGAHASNKDHGPDQRALSEQELVR